MSTEMKKLIIGGTEYEIVDDAGRTRITALEQGAVIGGGLSQSEKDYILELFEKAAYADNGASEAFNALSALWADSTVYRTITWNGTGYTKGNAASRVEDGAAFTSTVTANTGFNITAVSVTMGGNTVQGAWSSGTVMIPNVTGDIVITVSATRVGAAITKNITHCTSSNPADTVAFGASYTTTITADEDYNLEDSDITVTMGGVDITSTAVSSGGVITISNVTDDIEITALTHAWVTFINEDPSTWYIPPAATRDGSTVTFAPTSLNWDTVVKFKYLPYQYSALKNKRVRTMCSVVINGYTEGQGVNITPATFDTSYSGTRKAYVGDSTLHGTGWLTSSGNVFFDTGTDTLADVLTAGTTAADTEWVGASLYCNATSGCTAVVTNIKCQYLS